MFNVFDKNGKNVTSERDWYVDINGNLYFLTKDIGSPLMPVEEHKGYTLQICIKY